MATKRSTSSATGLPAAAAPARATDECVEVAREAGLRYVYDTMPGYTRKRAGKGFAYYDADRKRITHPETLIRIRSLAIPPAWTDVWICPSDRGHIQATGRDARGRKQYRYHPRWREVRDESKFDRMLTFSHQLPGLRRRVRADLGLPGLPREKVIAAVVNLLDRTFVRVGNDEYAKTNGSYGLTTMRNKHVRVKGDEIRFQFRGKSGRVHQVATTDPRCARVVRRCRELPGYRLFQYLDDAGEQRGIDSDDVNEYLRSVTGVDTTAKDFRTWAGTVLAARALHEVGPARSKAQTRRRITEAVTAVSELLGNTPSVARNCYIHPALIASYEDGTFEDLWQRSARARKPGLRPDEAITLSILRKLAAKQQRASRASGATAA